MKTVIIGAGLAGLQLARKLSERGEDFVVLEKETRIGGLCRTNHSGAFSWDFGVHALYSRNEAVMAYFRSLPIRYESLKRRVSIFHTGGSGRTFLLEYPFEIGIRSLPLKDKIECIHGYVRAHARGGGDFANLEGWIRDRLGKGIARHFMIPYNNKIWNCGLDEISPALVHHKIEPAPVRDFLSNIFVKKRIGRKYQAEFIYPRRGIQHLIDCIAGDISDRVRVGAGVVRLTRKGHRWAVTTGNGIEETADIVVSTMPLVELMKILCVEGIARGYDVFKWNDTLFVMIGLKGGRRFKKIDDCHWAFFKEDEVFYRVTLMHNFSTDFPPALVAEITRKDNVAGLSDSRLVDRVAGDLVRKGIIDSRDDIAETDIKLANYTYPIPTVGLDRVKDHLTGTLKRHRLFLLGRNGNWDYINMDGVVERVQALLSQWPGSGTGPGPG